MLDMLRDHQNNAHSARLEWIVIILILVEVGRHAGRLGHGGAPHGPRHALEQRTHAHALCASQP
jgi:hypothetical protein